MAPDTAARTTSPLQPETPAYLASRARSATLIGAAGLGTFFALVAVTRNTFLFDLGKGAWLFSGLILLNLVLAATASRWASWRWAIYAYEGVQVVVLSIILHRLGGLMMGILLITYAFPVIHGEMLRSDSSVFATANLCGACYAVMAWVEHEALRDVGVETQQQIAFVAIAFLTLNFLALYANRYGYQLRNLAWHLQAKVAERTAELGGLVARALETLHPQIAAKGVRVAVGPLPRVWGQARKLEHVVSNLLGNAVKYVAAEHGEIAVSGGAENGSVRLSVRDNGIGI